MARRKIFKIMTCILSLIMLISFAGCDFIFSNFPELCPHKWAEIERIDATCVDKGSVDLLCEYCKEEKTQILELVGHDYSTEWSSNNNNHWHVCKVCETIDQAANHTYVDSNGDNVCTICQYIQIQAKGAISFHFMMLGNDNAGDCTYIKAGDNDILIDAGSRTNSIDDIDNYIKQYCTDGKLEYVIVTHADQDHIAGFSKLDGSIFDLYECQTIIDFPLTDKTTQTYNNYVAERNDEVTAGGKRLSALDCYNNANGGQRVYNLTDDGNVKMEILYNYYYDHSSSDENNYSVCVMFYHGSRQFLFTGDLEKEGEEKLAEKYDFTQVELFKAGHHGSPTSSNDCLLSEIKPKISVACCCAGSVEYTQNFANTFPSQAYIDRIAPYTDKVYVPIYVGVSFSDEKDKYVNGETGLLNGNIQVISDAENGVTVVGSNNSEKLKDTDWFKANRTTPSYWQSA